MPNPFLPSWEYIPDGEPRVFGDRIYIYGSHDSAGTDEFCDYKLKVWSASVDDLNNWVCHGDIFHTRPDRDHTTDVNYTENRLFAPDVIEKNGKYYLYNYIFNAKGCVAVSDRPEGPFKLLSHYKYDIEKHYDDGTFIDPGVFIDDDGRVYLYCGYLGSYMVELNPENMYEVIDETYIENIIPADKEVEEDQRFFEGCSVRKVGDTYYMIYSPSVSSRLVYATSKSPRGPFKYRGCLVDNGAAYPGGNNHGSICKINEQWYLFYHRMTNGSIMSRRACVEKIDIREDGTIPQVEMTSLGFESSLNPYKITSADLSCFLLGGSFITEKNILNRVVTGITDGCVIGFKYFDFGDDFSSKTMEIILETVGLGCLSTAEIYIDEIEERNRIGECSIGLDSGIYTGLINSVVGRHAIYIKVKSSYTNWAKDMFNGRYLFELKSLLFVK